MGFVLFAGLAGLGAYGCAQGEGERCEIASDCESSLICEVTAGNGICRARGSANIGADAAGGSGGTDAVVSAPDAAVDARVDARQDVGSDVATPDAPNAPDVPAAPVDVAPDLRLDTSTPDAGATDAGDAAADQAG